MQKNLIILALVVIILLLLLAWPHQEAGPRRIAALPVQPQSAPTRPNAPTWPGPDAGNWRPAPVTPAYPGFEAGPGAGSPDSRSYALPLNRDNNYSGYLQSEFRFRPLSPPEQGHPATRPVPREMESPNARFAPSCGDMSNQP